MEEREFLSTVTANLGISGEDAGKGAQKAKENEGAIGELVSGIEDREYCVALFRDAYLMSLLNDGTDNVEWQVLERLSGALGLSTSLANKIVAMVDGLFNLREAYLEVLEEAEIDK